MIKIKYKQIYTAIMLLLLFLLSTPNLYSSAPQEVKQNDTMADGRVIQAIPLTDILSTAEATSGNLNKIKKGLQPIGDIMHIDTMLPKTLNYLNEESSELKEEKLVRLSRSMLESLYREWKDYQSVLGNWQKTINNRAIELRKQLTDLDYYSKTWKLTREEIKKSETPEEIYSRISEVRGLISKTEDSLSRRIEYLILIENNILDQSQIIESELEKIKMFRDMMIDKIFVKGRDAIWRPWGDEGEAVISSEKFGIAWKETRRAITVFVDGNGNRFFMNLLIFVVILAMNLYIRRRLKDSLSISDETSILAKKVFSRPLSAALLITMVLTSLIYPTRPMAVVELIYLLMLVPVLRLLTVIIDPKFHKLLYFIAVLYFLEKIQVFLWNQPLIFRSYIIFQIILAILVCSWILKRGSLFRESNLTMGWKYVKKLTPYALIILIVSLILNIIGFVNFSEVLMRLVIEGAVMAMVIVSSVIVIESTVVVFLRSSAVQSLYIIKNHGPFIERKARLILHIIAFFMWFKAVLTVGGFYRPVAEWFTDLLNKEWVLSKTTNTTISVEGIVSFILIIVITYFVVKIISIILEEEIFIRAKVPSGIATAISMVIKYFLVVLGIYVALGAANIDLSTFGLLAGALGIGLGFGLQNVVYNFVSGIILVFERPIEVGDTVEVETLMGVVKRIGVRSSNVRTFDGSEVIVPNGNLISNQLINWTLSDNRRRLTVEVKAAYGTDPYKVLDILFNVANNNPKVLKEPKPMALFHGYGEYALEFSILFWVYFDNSFSGRSEVALGIHDMLKQEGIEVAIPRQRVIFDEGGQLPLPPGSEEEK